MELSAPEGSECSHLLRNNPVHTGRHVLDFFCCFFINLRAFFGKETLIWGCLCFCWHASAFLSGLHNQKLWGSLRVPNLHLDSPESASSVAFISSSPGRAVAAERRRTPDADEELSDGQLQSADAQRRLPAHKSQQVLPKKEGRALM